MEEFVVCGKILSDLFETFETFQRCKITEFVRKVDFQNRPFGWIHFENYFFLNLLNNDDKR